MARAYLPRWSRHARAIVLSHDTLLLYKGILAVVPHEQLLFVRIRRARDEFVASFSRYDTMARDWYRYEPSSHECALPVTPETWEAMDMRQRAAWFHDETEARWRQLRAEQPDLQVLEVEWSKEQAGSFDAVVRAIECATGLHRRAEGVPIHRKAGSAKRHCPPQVPECV